MQPATATKKFDVPNSVSTIANGVNAHGDIVGRFDDAAGVTHGFLLRNNVYTTLDFPKATLTAARAINAQGDVVGSVENVSGQHGFILHEGVFTQIDYPGATTTTALGINNSGDITGSRIDPSGVKNAFILQNGVFTNVRFPSSLRTCSTDVWMVTDDAVTLVGSFWSLVDGGIHGYIRYKPGSFEVIDVPAAGFPCASVRSINEKGDMVGVYSTYDDDCAKGESYGFLLSQGIYTYIDFPSSCYTDASAINDDEIVGDFIDQKNLTTVSEPFRSTDRDGNPRIRGRWWSSLVPSCHFRDLSSSGWGIG